jgi:hypothetical protein
MPRRLETISRRARLANLGEWEDAFFAFVNTGSAAIGSHSFDAQLTDHASVRSVVLDVLVQLHAAAHAAGGAARRPALTEWRSRFPKSRRREPTAIDPSTASRELLEQFLIDNERHCRLLRKEIQLTVLVTMCEKILDEFFLNPKIAGYRFLGHCPRCKRWFRQPHIHSMFCGPLCRRESEQELTRARVRRFRGSAK